MSLSLRTKFILLILPPGAVLAALLYVLNAPYREMKELLSDIHYDIVQVVEAENFLRFSFRQHNEILHNILTKNDDLHTGHRRAFQREAEDALGRWQAAFQAASFPEEDRRNLQNTLDGVGSSFNQVTLLADKAMEYAREGRTSDALRICDTIDDTLVSVLVPQTESAIQHLTDETRHNVPVFLSLLGQMSLFRTGVVSTMEKINYETNQMLGMLRLSRYVYGEFRGVFDVVLGHEALSLQRHEVYGRKIEGIIAYWESEMAQTKAADDMQRLGKLIQTGRDALARLEATRKEALALVAQGRQGGAERLLIRDTDLADLPLLQSMEVHIKRDSASIRQSLSAASEQISRIQRIIAVISAGVLLLWVVTLLALSRSIVRPVAGLKNAVLRLSEGDFAAPVGRASSDEVGTLVEAFGAMRAKLRMALEDLSAEVSTRKRAEEEKERTIADLKQALAEIKTLSGLLPICASCKKIRDDRGYWTQVETYVSDHSMAEFSHGICPDCEEKAYAELSHLKKQADRPAG